MKVYTQIVIDIKTGQQVVAESYDYNGDVALCKGDEPKREDSASGKVVRDLYGRRGGGPLGGSLRNILANPGDDPFTQRQLDVLTQRSRAGMGARGLASSGIGLESEQNVQRDFLLNRGEQKQNQAISILGAGGTAPQLSQSQPRGFMGLK